LTSALVGGEWSASRPGRFTPRERAQCSHWIGGWVDPRARLDNAERRKFLTLPGLELQSIYVFPSNYNISDQGLREVSLSLGQSQIWGPHSNPKAI
jgi:hypothetical protein